MHILSVWSVVSVDRDIARQVCHKERVAVSQRATDYVHEKTVGVMEPVVGER